MGTQTGSISFETANGLKSYASQNYATLSQIKGQFAISNSSASEINKTATIVPANSNWTLYSGATITVKFVNKNTAAASPPPELTLNVNNTGAKTIKDYAGNQLQQSASKWEDKTTMVLTYDGTNWRIQDTNIMERIHSMDSSIEQTATSIVSLVSNQDYYITPDGTTGENIIKSTFTQQANAIDARVEKDGVIAAINASVEEIEGITGSSLQIQADKVNIAGAAIFTNNGRLSETSLNNTYSPISTTTTAVYRTQRIYYRATEAQSNLTGPTTWLSTSGTGYGNWSTSIPQLINNGTKYSFLYTCTQTQTVAQANNGTTCTCSEVLLDNSTTVIDGGSIITNSIDANKISISDISALGATIGGFEIDDTSIHTRQIGVTSNADNSIALSSVDFTRTINNIPHSGLRFAMGDKFAVTGDGTVYASGITINESQVAGLTGDLIDAEKIATNFITEIGATGIMVHPNGQTGDYVLIDSTGMEVFKDDISMANFSDVIRIGQTGEGHTTITNSEIGMYDSSDRLALFYQGKVDLGKYDTFILNDTGFSLYPSNSSSSDYANLRMQNQYTTKQITKNFEPQKEYQIEGDIVSIDEIRFIFNNIEQVVSSSDYVVTSVESPVRLDRDGKPIYGHIKNTYIEFNTTPPLNALVVIDYTIREYLYAMRLGSKDFNNFIVDNNGAKYQSTNGSRMELDYHSLKLIDREQNTYFYISDLRDENGIAEITERFVSDGNSRPIYYLFSDARFIIDIVEVKLNNVITTDYTIATSGQQTSGQQITIEFNTKPPADSVILITYTTRDPSFKAMTFGERDPSKTIGAYSVCEGYYGEASGFLSHAEGFWTKATNDYSHAEGNTTTANGKCSHAEGQGTTANENYSHAEGYNTTASGYSSHAEGRGTTVTVNGSYSHAEGYNTTASELFSHAEGSNTTASGECSHAQNKGTVAASLNQTALGSFNIEDTDDTYAVIIGNGTSTSNRSNITTIDWNAATKLWHPSIQRDTVPSSAIYGGGGSLELADHNGSQIGYFQPIQLTDGSVGIQIGVSNEDDTDWNNIQLTFNGSTPGVSVSHKKEWRNAIGAAMYDFYQATGGSGTISAASNTITPITLVTTDAISNGSGFSISNGGIKVANAGKYRVTASVYILGTNATFKGVYVKKNNNSTGGTGELIGLHYPYTASGIQVGPKVVSLEANDVLYLCGRIGGVAGTIYTDNKQTYLLVERIA